MKKTYACVRVILAGCAASGTFVSSLADESPDNSVDTIVVTASRLDQSRANPTQTVEVISRDELARLHAASATEVIRQVPGANVSQQGGRGGASSILLRGGEPNFTVVLIDGIQVNDPANFKGGSYDINNMEQAQVERVEIAFGPMSSLYGSDALSGALNFISRGATAGSSVSVEGGTQGYGSLSAFYGGPLGAVDSGFGVYATNDDGDVDGSEYESVGLNGKFGGELGRNGSAELVLGYQLIDSTTFPDDSGGPELAVIRDVDTREIEDFRIGLELDYDLSEQWRAGLSANHYRRDEDFSSPGIAPGVLDPVPPNSADTEFDRTQLLATLGTDISPNLAALAGAEWQNESGDSQGIIDLGFPVPTDFEIDRDTLSAFAEASLTAGRFMLQGALRWDDPEAASSELTSRLGLLYDFANGRTRFRANWGEGFKTPSFFALAHPIVGNPDLRPETGESVDLGISHRFEKFSTQIDFGVFYNEFEDLIDFDDTLFTNVNRDEVETKGAEATVQFSPAAGLVLRAHATWLDSDIKGSDTNLRSRPEWRGGAILDWQVLPNWRWLTSLLVSDDFYESSVPTGDVLLDGYARVDTALTWRVSEALKIGFAIDNLFDEDYHEAVGFPAAGIRGRIGADFSF